MMEESAVNAQKSFDHSALAHKTTGAYVMS